MTTIRDLILGGGGVSPLMLQKELALKTVLGDLTKFTDLPRGFGDTFLYETQIPRMTAEYTDGTTITAKSTISTNYPFRVADRLNGVDAISTWSSSAAPTESVTQWVKISRDAVYIMARYNIITRADPVYTYSPNTWYMFVSTALTPSTYDPLSSWLADPDWTLVHSVSGNTVNTPNTRLGDYNITPVPYRHVACVSTERNGGAARVAIGEMNIYGSGVNGSELVNATLNRGYITFSGAASVTSVAKTVDTVPANATGLILAIPGDAVITEAVETANSLRLSFSRDNGATWTWLPLADDGVVTGSIHRYSCDKKLLTSGAGTQIKLRVTTHDIGAGAPTTCELHGWACVFD